ncbi:MAG: hypothetical protein PHY73_07665 [Candidatus Omnitrophica bacterium]|nr:hypothetical protein [Candidatus Omnitrophota bacterium]
MKISVAKNSDEVFNNVQLYISHLFRIALIIAMCLDVYFGRWMLLFLNCIALFLMFLPAIIEHNYKITLPIELELLFVFFIFGSMFLGETFDYYHKFWWWDVMLHCISGLILGYIGFIILYVFYSEKLIKARPFLLVMFSFSFAVALGTIWEIFEFFMDNTFGFNMQKSGLVDTMWDLIIDCLGAFVVSLFGYIYLKYHKGWFLKDLILKFVRNNPNMFVYKQQSN